MSALHIFDMDGTLLQGTTASLEISRRLDRVRPLEDLEARFSSGEITTDEFAVHIHRLWHDLTDEVVAAVVSAVPWMEGISDVCADISARGEVSMLITMSPDFFAEHLRAQGIDIIYASRFPALPFVAAVDPRGILTPADKVHLAEKERVERGLPKAACVAYGDSLSDEPLFAALDNTVAVNADLRLEKTARLAYRGSNLREPYVQASALLDQGMTL